MRRSDMTGAELRAIRLELGLSQQAMAEALGYGAFARVSEFERGARPILERTAKVARALLAAHRQAAA